MKELDKIILAHFLKLYQVNCKHPVKLWSTFLTQLLLSVKRFSTLTFTLCAHVLKGAVTGFNHSLEGGRCKFIKQPLAILRLSASIIWREIVTWNDCNAEDWIYSEISNVESNVKLCFFFLSFLNTPRTGELTQLRDPLKLRCHNHSRAPLEISR